MKTETGRAPEELTVNELFYSIQGESSFAGFPCLFIRLSGCNLRCNYCDTSYAWEEEGKNHTLDDLLAYAERYPGVMVEITGGEPLLQANVLPLMARLVKAGRRVLLETNGSLDIGAVPPEVIIIMDLKCPGSGMHSHLRLENLALLKPTDEIKFVISSRDDYEWGGEMIKRHRLDRIRQIHFSPVTEKILPARLADWILADRLPVRLQLQLHRVLWPTEKRGV